MRDSLASGFVALAAILCCALPLLFLSGFLITGSGFALNQQALFGLGILVVISAGLLFLVLKLRSRGR